MNLERWIKDISEDQTQAIRDKYQRDFISAHIRQACLKIAEHMKKECQAEANSQLAKYDLALLINLEKVGE